MTRRAAVHAVLVLAALAATFAVSSASAQPAYPEIVLEVYRVQAVDSIEPLGDPSFYYYLGIRDVGDWVWRGPMTLPDGPDVLVNSTHTFTVRAPAVGVAIVLCEADSLNADDAADLSSRLGGGPDDNGCPLSSTAPPDYAFQGVWDLLGDDLTGDLVLPESGYLRSSGDLDGSMSVDENDANLWFRITDAYESPVAAMGFDRTVGAGEVVWFDGGSSNAAWGVSIESYEWDLDGDGANDASGRVASRAYAAGTYTVRLRVMDSLGVADEGTVLVRAGNRVPWADFAFSPPEPYAGQDVEFLAVSYDPDGAIASRLWSFGDGATSAEARATHRYARAGSYALALEVTDDDGARVVTSRSIVVRNSAPLAAFSAVPDAADPTLVRFREGAVDLDGTVEEWRWDFGDGSFATEPEPSHRYAGPGSYVVLLQVRDDLGALASVSATVVVQRPTNPAWFAIPVLLAVFAAVGFLWFLRRRTRAPGSGSPPKALALLLAASAVLAATPTGIAYGEAPPIGSPASTHQWILDQAVGILAADGHPGLADWMDGAFLEEMKRGTIRADRTLVDSGDHYHDPWTHAGLPGFRSAADLGAEEFQFALDAWYAGDILGAAFHLGYAAHLVMDATVPHHARLAPLNFHAEYEAFVGADRASAAVASNGTYAFNATLAGHFEDPWDPWDWVDRNAHTSYDWFAVASSGDPGDFAAAMGVLLPIAQRTTAGFLLMFLQTVNEPPEVQILGPRETTVGVPFSLRAVVSEDIAVDSYSWTLDSGGGDTRVEGAFEFPTPGNHTVLLRVTDVLGSSADASHPVHVAFAGGPRAFVSGPAVVGSGDAVTFDGSGSAPDVVRFEWTVDASVAGSGPTLSVLLEGSRVALVALQVWDVQGRNDTARYPVVVEDRRPPAVDLPDRLAAIAGQPTVLGAGRYVDVGDAARTVWYIDGDPAEGSNATVAFAEPGVHVIALVAFDPAGNAGFDSAVVTVEAQAFPVWIPVVGVVVAMTAIAVGWRRHRR